MTANYKLILPVLFLEYLSISITRSILPGLIVDEFGSYSYIIIGIIETLKGLFAFVSCPLIGKISDEYGRKYFLLITMIGTTFPICFLAWNNDVWIYTILVGFSGIFAATFALTFAYISDIVDKENCAAAFGMALATFGLSFTVGPVLGGYLAANYGPDRVFRISNVLVILNILYIVFVLPESNPKQKNQSFSLKNIEIPVSWNLADTFKIFWSDPFLANLALVVLFYYTAVWAMVSTLMVFVTRYLQMDSLSLGYLLSTYGLLTMFSEGVIVRVAVPAWGELACIRVGLFAYACQALMIVFATDASWIFGSLAFSMLSNLVYPSICSLVTKVVGSRQGEALGALNGIKSLTEGLGPLLFGSFMTLFENSVLPSAPYVLISYMALWAMMQTFELPKNMEVAHEKYSVDVPPEARGLLSETDLEDEHSI